MILQSTPRSFSERRIAITGMAVNTPLADRLPEYRTAILSGRSAITRWRSIPADRIGSKIGGDLGCYDAAAKLASLAGRVPDAMLARATRLMRTAPWSVQLSILLALDAWADAGLHADNDRPLEAGVIVGGYHLQNRYTVESLRTFGEEPDFVDPNYAVHSIESTHAGCVSEVLHLHAIGMQVSAACASGLFALRSAVDEIRWHGRHAVVVVGAVADFSPMDLHALSLLGAISQDTFNDEPHRASRPFDRRREGFVPAHGGAALVLEELEHATRRGAHVHAEVLGVETSANASHLPRPSVDGQARAMHAVLQQCGIPRESIDYVNGHFTSTPQGDLAELLAIKQVFGAHAYALKTNATKSLVGHTLGAAALVELVGAVLQVQAGRLHPSLNIEDLDPAVDLDVCAAGAIDWPVRYLMKNSSGFGGMNASAILAASASDPHPVG